MKIQIGVDAVSDIMKMERLIGAAPSEQVRIGLSLLRLVIEEERKGNQVVVATPRGEVLRKIELPIEEMG